MSAPARIGVNLLWLVPGVVGGSEEYTTRLLAGLAERPPGDLALTLYVTDDLLAAHPDLGAAYPTVVAPPLRAGKGGRVLAESTWLARRAAADGMRLVHHGGGTIPPVRSRPAIVTIHDLQPLLLPANFSPVKRAYIRWRLPRSARHARLVITLTEHGRAEAVDVLGARPDRVVVVPPGYAPRIAEAPEGDVAAAHRLDRPFFLYPAITYPHKNHAVLVRALARVAQDHDVLLVLTGGEAQEEEALARLARELGVADRVRRLGRVPRGDLDWMLDHALALAFPSRFEGFGLPVLEAMGHGCPVIASAATVLPEVVGGAGVLVGPDDVDGWAGAMAAMARDPERRARLAAAGRERTAAWSWARSVAAAVDAYRRALEVVR